MFDLGRHLGKTGPHHRVEATTLESGHNRIGHNLLLLLLLRAPLARSPGLAGPGQCHGRQPTAVVVEQRLGGGSYPTPPTGQMYPTDKGGRIFRGQPQEEFDIREHRPPQRHGARQHRFPQLAAAHGPDECKGLLFVSRVIAIGHRHGPLIDFNGSGGTTVQRLQVDSLGPHGRYREKE